MDAIEAPRVSVEQSHGARRPSELEANAYDLPLVDADARRQVPSLVSVVVPVRDDAGALASQLDCLASQQYRGAWEVIIADNGSTDGSIAVATGAAHRFPRLEIVDASTRPGACHARNRGAAAAKGDLLAFCDADDEVGSDWLASFASAARDYDVLGGWLDRDALNQGVERSWRPFADTPDRLPVALGFQPYALSGNCAIWRDVLEAVGGWNESYAACTDVELSWRALRAGKRVGFVPNAVVRYRFRARLEKLARQFFRLGRAEAQLYRDFRGDGLRRNGREALRSWAWIVVNVPRAFSRSRRGFWVRVATRRLGRLWGSARAGVFFP
jgi:glycosyltransferase involved in cell wall biosynthesis